MRIIQVPEGQGALGNFHASRQFSHCQSFRTKVALLNNALHAPRKLLIDLGDELPGIPEIETSGTERTGRHAEPAADATMKIHQHNAVGAFKGCLGRASPDTGGFFAVVAKCQKR